MSGQVNPELPPENFDHTTASDDELDKYGFPPRPDATLLPEARALWDATMSVVQEYVPPDLTEVRIPGMLFSPTWSGAILDPRPSPALKFFMISSYWIIPNAYPPTCKREGTYRCYSFVAFDGWQEPRTPSPPALIFGTKSVVRDGNHFAKVFLQVNGCEHDFCLRVMPGDLVTAYLWVLDRPTISPRRFGVYLVNRNTGNATRAQFDLPADFQGTTAEWILARQKIDYGQVGVATEALPNYGATFYHNTCALASPAPRLSHWRGVQHFTVDQAKLIDMVGTGTRSTDVISTAEHVKKNILLVYAYKDEPRNGLSSPGRVRSSE